MDTWLSMFILMMISVGCTCTSDSRFPTYHEGDVAILKFQYNSREITANETIQICRGNQLPFYIAGNISQAGLTDNEVGRFSVQEGYARDEEGNDIYLIVVTIQNVTSNDGGTYICSVRKYCQILGKLDRRIGLTVHFPPRKASCHFVDNTFPMNKEWTNLECTASRGSYFGFFDCYKDGEKMPYLTRPTHNYTHVKQILLVKKNQPVVCCSTSYERPTKRPSCTDFSWFPLEGTTHHNIEEASHETTDKSDQPISSPSSVSEEALTHLWENDPDRDSVECSCGRTKIVWFAIGSSLSTCFCAILVMFAFIYKILLRSKKPTFHVKPISQKDGESMLNQNNDPSEFHVDSKSADTPLIKSNNTVQQEADSNKNDCVTSV